MVGRSRAVVALAVLSLAAASCTAGRDGADELTIAHVHGLGIAGDTLFVATHTGLFVREDGEWSRRSEDTADHMGFTLISERLMFRSGHPPTGGNLGVQRSTDGGRTWETVSTVMDQPVDFHAMAGGGEPLAIYGWSQRLFRAVGDPGEWEAVAAEGLGDTVGALAAGDGNGVYASTAEGLFRSSDGGDSWRPVSDRRVFAVAVASDGRAVYASSVEEPLVLRSADEGASWETVSDGLDATRIIVAIATSPDGQTVAAADADAAIWMSEDAGATWTEVPTP